MTPFAASGGHPADNASRGPSAAGNEWLLAEMAERFETFGMSGRDFERAICALFRGLGYTVTGFAGARMDLGLKKDGARYLARLGFWQKPEVGCIVAQALAEEIAAHGARGGFVVTGGRFTAEARAIARAARIELIDGETLAALIDPPATIDSPRVQSSASTTRMIPQKPTAHTAVRKYGMPAR